MDILFKTKKLEKVFNNHSMLIRNYGDRCARLIMRRLDDLHAADNLAVLGSLPPARCHELVGNKKG